jgi:glycerophosphoryl diester phosphodiesterase
LKRTLIWAHRGASQSAPENTLAAFDLAIRQQADGIELDVQRTADGILVVAHDEDCQRVTGAAGLVSQLTLAGLRQLNFAATQPTAGFMTLPTLAEVFDLVRPSSLTINIELKNTLNLYPGMEEQVLQLAVEHQMQDRIQLSSFNHYSLVEAQRLIQAMRLAIPCGPLYDCGLVEPWQYAGRYHFAAIHPHFGNLRIPGLVEQCHAAGIAVNTWTIDQSVPIGLALRLGVDAIITNVPDQAILIREKYEQMED